MSFTVDDVLGVVKKKQNIKNVPSEKLEKEPFDNVMGNISQNWEVKNEAVANKNIEEKISPKPIDEYILKIRMLEKENEALRESRSSLGKNEEKVLNAIRSEALKQKRQDPVIGRAKFIKEYKINSKYLDDSFRLLIQKKLIKKTSVKYSAKILTHSWEILDQ